MELSYRIKDLIGQVFGRLTVLGATKQRLRGAVCWRCRCTCGKTVAATSSSLKKPRIERSCGCVGPGAKAEDVVGQTFGRLTAICRTAKRGPRGVLWQCLCLCGTIVYTSVWALKRPARHKDQVIKSCGCARRGPQSSRYKGAGSLSGQKWGGIRRDAKRRKLAFTITVIQAWALLEKQGHCCALTGVPIVLPLDVGAGKATASLDRIDNGRGYVSGNVQWVHITINLMKHVLSDAEVATWCKEVVAFSLRGVRRPTPRGIFPRSSGCVLVGVRSPRYAGVGDLSGERWKRMKAGAAQRGLSMKLTIKQAWSLFERQGRKCALTGKPLTMSPTSMKAGASTASLDRIDSSKGYSLRNVQWVHVTINLMKHTLSNDEFVGWCGKVVAYLAGPLVVGSNFGKGTKANPHHY